MCWIVRHRTRCVAGFTLVFTCRLDLYKYVPWISKRSSISSFDGNQLSSFRRSGSRVFVKQDLLALLARYATSAEDINTIVDRIHKNHRFVGTRISRMSVSGSPLA